MPYVAMARRYRPATFDEVVGQDHVAQTLKNAIRTSRIAHAYLFCGPHGVGKTSMARIFAKALNCTGGPLAELPADCPICEDITVGNDPDVIEIDGASNNSVDQVRTLREQAGYVPQRATFKIYIIDEVHMLSNAAFNALLKTLEEPPAHVKFILATTEPHKLLETVLSRCQRFDFRLVPAPVIAKHLKDLCAREEAKAEDDALEAIAAFAGGSMRDGLVLLDQLMSYCPEGITRQDVEQVRGVAGIESVTGLFDAIIAHDCAGALRIVDEVAARGAGIGDYLDQLIQYGRDLMLRIVTGSDEGLTSYGPARGAVARQSESVSLAQSLLILDVLSQARVRVRSRALSNPLVPLEMAIARLAGLESLESTGEIVARLEELAASGALSGGADVVVTSSAAAPAPPPSVEKETADVVTPPPTGTQAGPAQEAIVEESTREAIVEESKPEPTPEPEVTPEVIRKEEPVREAVARPTTPAASSTPTSPDNAESLTLEHVRDHWDDILEEIHAGYPPDARYMNDVTLLEVKERTLIFQVPVGSVFLIEQLADPDRRRRLEAAASKVLGTSVVVHIVLADGPVAEEKAEPRPNKRQVLRDPAVQAVMDRFQGEVLNIEDDSDRR